MIDKSLLPPWESRRNGLGSPLGIETTISHINDRPFKRRNGLGSPLGIETYKMPYNKDDDQGGEMAWGAR